MEKWWIGNCDDPFGFEPEPESEETKSEEAEDK